MMPMAQFKVFLMEDGRRLLMEEGARYPKYDYFYGFYGWRATLQ